MRYNFDLNDLVSVCANNNISDISLFDKLVTPEEFYPLLVSALKSRNIDVDAALTEVARENDVEEIELA